MQIFISWSGEKSRRIAEVLRHWLPDVIQSVRPYFTPDDVAKGQRWATEIAENLHSSEFGLFCLTAENLSAPWLLFEAGAVSKDSRNGKVFPLLFGVEPAQLAGPLLQFQATPYSRTEVFKFMKAVNDGTSVPLTEYQLERAFDRCWDELDEKIQKVLTTEAQNQSPFRRSQEDMIEETLGIVRAMSLNPPSSIDEDSLTYAIAICQITQEYARDTLSIAESADQLAMLSQLKRLSAYVRMVGNMMSPKLKSNVGAVHLLNFNKVLKQIEFRIDQLSSILNDDLI